MKGILSFIAKTVVVILIILLVVFSGEICRFAQGFLPDAYRNAVVDTTQMTHELRSMGVLVVSEYTDTGTFVSTLPALVIKEAQRVTVPYAYTISFGVNLEEATITSDDNVLFISLPEATMTHDKLSVTGEVKVNDFLFPLTEARYQEILDEQNAAFRAAYLEDRDVYDTAKKTAQEKVEALLLSLLKAQGAAEDWSLIFAE